MKAITAFVLIACLGACATASPPQELVSARSAYDRASHGIAAQLDPADLQTAKETLDSAEKSFANDGDAPETRDAAYTAELQAETAEAHARAKQTGQQKDQVVAQMNANQTAAVRSTAAALGQANQQLASQGQALQNKDQQLMTKDQQLAAERQRREDAEKRAAQAAGDLARIATSVKQETRGMVITLSGSVLFVSGKADLLPEAQAKLSQVADALTKQDPDSKMVVEGHTDSQGAASFNQDLSQRRADSVRAYLVSHGIAADRITAQGVGSSRPVADNGSAEGRANNRRVEIIVQPKASP